MTTISKKSSPIAKDSLVIICKSFKPNATYALSKEQNDYILNDIKKNDKKAVTINALDRTVSVVLVDEAKNHYTNLELIRKHGGSLSDAINADKRTAICVVNELVNADYSLALAEGLALGNYQFIKHKPSDSKKVNTLTSISIIDAKVLAQHVSNLSIAVDATLKARDLVNEPVNYLNAIQLSQAFKKMGKDAGFIALRAGIGCGAEAVLYPESDVYIDHLLNKLSDNKKRKAHRRVKRVIEGS